MSNPFKPTAGRIPPVLVGRKNIIADFEYALEDGPGAPGRLMFLTGARGVGKTVMLDVLGDKAKTSDGPSSTKPPNRDSPTDSWNNFVP